MRQRLVDSDLFEEQVIIHGKVKIAVAKTVQLIITVPQMFWLAQVEIPTAYNALLGSRPRQPSFIALRLATLQLHWESLRSF